MEIFNSPKLRKVMNTILLAFIFYFIAAASFNGFFLKWGFRESNEAVSFQAMYDETAMKPFVHRQLMVKIAKKIHTKFLNEDAGYLIDKYQRLNIIPSFYPKANIEPRYSVEYHIVYFMCVIFLFLSMFVWREIGFELTGSRIAGTLAAICFAILFPILETGGGYFYDFGELLFLSLTALCACKGWWLAIIILSPVAEYNKESFLFFVITLFSLLALKLGKKKSAAVVIIATFLCGLVYLYVKQIFAGNPGGFIQFHLPVHLENLGEDWFTSEINFGMLTGQGTYLPHILLVAWIVKCAWKKLSTAWKHHIFIALAINMPLYLLFCWPGELRNLSMLYIGFIAMTSIYIKILIDDERSD